jgi:hypothetical protein
MSAFNEAYAIFMHAHGAVSASDDAPGIPQTLESTLINNLNPEVTFDEKVKTGGMGEKALTLTGTLGYELGVDCEFTSLTGPWINRHPGECFTYESLGLYSSVTGIRHKFPTGNGCSWRMKAPKQGLRAGDLRKGDLVLELLFKPTLSAQLVTPAAVA